MENRNIKFLDSKVPHAPYIIVDDEYNLIATIHHSLTCKEDAELFTNAPKMKNLLWRIFSEISNSKESIPLSFDLVNDITLMLTTLENDKAKDWKDKIFDKHKDEKLPDVFTGEDENE
jgi:hypothetical protein